MKRVTVDPEQIERLVELARRGDREAVGMLLERWHAELDAFVRRRAGSDVLARESGTDIVQSACREVLGNLEGAPLTDGSDGLKAWLFQATLHKIIDRHRYWNRAKRDPNREVARERWSRESLDALIGALAAPSVAAERAELFDRVATVLEQLPEHYETVLRLAYFERLPQREIAAEMERSEDSVRGLIARALARLTRLVGDGG